MHYITAFCTILTLNRLMEFDLITSPNHEYSPKGHHKIIVFRPEAFNQVCHEMQTELNRPNTYVEHILFWFMWLCVTLWKSSKHIQSSHKCQACNIFPSSYNSMNMNTMFFSFVPQKFLIFFFKGVAFYMFILKFNVVEYLRQISYQKLVTVTNYSSYKQSLPPLFLSLTFFFKCIKQTKKTCPAMLQRNGKVHCPLQSTKHLRVLQ